MAYATACSASQESKCRPGNVELLGVEALDLQIALGKPPRSNVENFNADQIFYALTEVEQPARVQRWRMN